MFTLVISSTPIAITDADEAQAREIFNSDEFKQDLSALTSEGSPLWDGQASLHIRPASQEEIAAFGTPDEDLDDLDDDEDGVFVTFLVPIDHDHEAISAVPPELQS
jgi:alkanesulfonate monooxygenase SsuD/methylene tetrahydromethanopterin reductase-like flavin-dependent oxidoreductase (luciferase family)